MVSIALSGVSLLVVAGLGWWNIRLGKRTTKASEDSAQATERAVKASERAATLAEQVAKLRRVAGVMDVVLEMREIFNEQIVANSQEPWVPAYSSLETVARTALMRKLEGRLVFFEHELDSTTSVRTLTTTYNWSTTILDQAVTEVTDLLKATADLS